MNRGTILFLYAAVFVMGITVLCLCLFWLPDLADYMAELFPEFAYLKWPVLTGAYLTVIPFYYALFQAIKLLRFIDEKRAFTDHAVTTLQRIKQCALVITILYTAGIILLGTQNALHAGLALIGFIVIFAALTIAFFAVVLQAIFSTALKMKAEIDLTV
ncbi:DUF2975 domain-containing protein [Peribacillus frigoritolerans]|uniref:DUF2975 domain-containing protein n=1 Tax=Peribacillus frigoritolerans TaxID=450367 RepID=UPI00105AA4B6|nr:DUF2975 domain-containing protein [Peribacillus frigoritolerans]TDL82724.1 DUF2975 domain-containing protein [Peribacillus frigoritolerans]